MIGKRKLEMETALDRSVTWQWHVGHTARGKLDKTA
jgi:hypothetical protein